MIRFERVSKRYDEGHDALREVSFEIAKDDLVFPTTVCAIADYRRDL